ncbi:MAG: chromosome segregation protein SMC, partial [Rhodocyclaceae bacterium]|nr:chromosome segregation protein SMC [Rhodocyclaceae bacterium]
MRLSRLKLAGFKTFVDPTTVLAPGQLVGVVGPNGCGKSNIIDAVRWVLGETRASALRGASMQDVIFNGSATRKPVSRASVELVFDNADGKAAGQWSHYAEISVKRVLDRSGDSSYYINNVLVRRKDVVDLFLGTGLGPRAYAIIEQGMISRIIEARPEEIRGFLEEAAGVTKYRERRRETEGRLADARDNLLRLDDITVEMGERIARLEAQAQVAERYRTLSAEHVLKQQLLWLLKRDEAAAEAGRSALALNQASAQMEADSARLASLATAIDAAREDHLKASDAVHVAQNELYAATAEVSRLESEARHLNDNRERLATRIEQLGGELTHWQARHDGLGEEQARWTSLREAADLRHGQAEARRAAAADTLPDTEAQFRSAEATAAAARRELAQTEQQLRVEDARCSSARRALDAIAQRRARLQREGAGIASPQTEAIGEQEALCAAAESALLSLEKESAALQADVPALQAAFKTATAEERDAQRQLTETRARRDALAQVQKRAEQQGELGAWLKQRGLDTAPVLWTLLRVEAGWEMAVEAVLRERLAALPEGEGVDVASLLAAPPPATLALWRAVDAEPDGTAAPEGALPLSRFVHAEPQLTASLARWLAGVYAVDDLSVWLDRRDRLPPGVRLVNPAGQCLTRETFIHYSGDARTHGVIERAREIAALDGLIETLADAQTGAHARVAVSDEKLSAAQNRLSALRRDLQTHQIELHARQVALLKLTQARDRAVEQQARVAGDLADIASAEGVEREHLDTATAELARCEALVAALRTRAEHATAVRTEREAALRQSQAQLQALAREVQEADFSRRECAGKLEDIERNGALAAEQLARIAGERDARRAEREAVDPAV